MKVPKKNKLYGGAQTAHLNLSMSGLRRMCVSPNEPVSIVRFQRLTKAHQGSKMRCNVGDVGLWLWARCMATTARRASMPIPNRPSPPNPYSFHGSQLLHLPIHLPHPFDPLSIFLLSALARAAIARSSVHGGMGGWGIGRRQGRHWVGKVVDATAVRV